MLSLGKILLLLAVGYAVFSLGRRLGARRAPPPAPPGTARPPAESLVRCPACGVYRAPGLAEDCPREDCPLRRKS
ncbi:MAG: hypothetical protein AB7D00_13235 [Rhodospirillaceae bacterium]